MCMGLTATLSSNGGCGVHVGNPTGKSKITPPDKPGDKDNPTSDATQGKSGAIKQTPTPTPLPNQEPTVVPSPRPIPTIRS